MDVDTYQSPKTKSKLLFDGKAHNNYVHVVQRFSRNTPVLHRMKCTLTRVIFLHEHIGASMHNLETRFHGESLRGMGGDKSIRPPSDVAFADATECYIANSHDYNCPN